MTATKYIITTFIGRQKRYIFSTGHTTGSKLQVEYSTKMVDAELFNTEGEAKNFSSNINNPFERKFTIEPTQIAETPLEQLMATLPVVVDEKKLDRKTVIKKLKKLK